MTANNGLLFGLGATCAVQGVAYTIRIETVAKTDCEMCMISLILG
jgi:hypothetical protein